MSKAQIIPESAVCFVRALPASPRKLWQFLTETGRLAEWYGEGRIEPNEGGAVSLMGGHIRGVVTLWQPEERLGYTWNVFSPGETQSGWPISYLELALEPDDAGSRLTLTHRPIPQAMQNQTAMGWHTYLDLLEAGVKDQFPRRADLFPKNAALYGVDLSNIKR